MTVLGNTNLLLRISRAGANSGDPVYITVTKATNKINRPIKGIAIPIVQNNQTSTDPLQKIIDLKRDTETYTFEGFLVSDSVSDDAWTKRTAVKSICQLGGVITIVYRGLTIVGACTDLQLEDDANRSDLHIGATGYNLPEKISCSFTILVGINI